MKKTCMNCKKYHAVLVSKENAFHIHDWCEQWKTALYAFAKQVIDTYLSQL